jgi:23S rRNA pseudouridine2605 synthase
MPAERISKVLATAGVASRRGADELVAQGGVTVDGRPAELGQKVDPTSQSVVVDGRPLRTTAPALVHLVLHKPPGVTSTARDRHARLTVVGLIPRDLTGDARLYPVGRLDQDSEGLILLTNDGPWADAVLHPSHGVEREYAIAVRHPLDVDQGRALERGIELEEGIARLHGLREQTRTESRRLGELLAPPVDPRLVWYRATLDHGWKRQLRRMFAGVGATVARLARVRIGPLRLEDLASGESRALTAAEVRRLRATGNAPARPDDPWPREP